MRVEGKIVQSWGVAYLFDTGCLLTTFLEFCEEPSSTSLRKKSVPVEAFPHFCATYDQD